MTFGEFDMRFWTARRLIPVVLGIFLTATASFAQDSIRVPLHEGIQQSAPQQNQAPVTLDQLVDEALKTNPEIRALIADIAAAEGGITTTTTWQNPEFSGSPGATKASGTGTEFHTDLEFTQTIEFPGKRALRRAVGQKDVELRQLALAAFRFQLTIQVRRVFFQILASHQLIELKQQRLSLATSFLEAAKKKVEGGFAPEFEATKAEVEVVVAQKALRDAQASHNVAHAELSALLGRKPGAPMEVTGELEGIVPSLSESRLYEQALARNPSLKIQTAEIERADLNLRSVRRSRLPDFNIGPNLEYTRDEQTYGFGVSLPLPLWDRKRGPIATATAEQQRAEAGLERLEQEILRDISAASQKLGAAKESLSYYTAEFREKLRSALDASGQSYAEGRTTLLIYLETQRTYFDAQADYFETLQGLFDAQAELEAALGVPLAEIENPTDSQEKK